MPGVVSEKLAQHVVSIYRVGNCIPNLSSDTLLTPNTLEDEDVRQPCKAAFYLIYFANHRFPYQIKIRHLVSVISFVKGESPVL